MGSIGWYNIPSEDEFVVSEDEKRSFRPCLVGRKFSVFCIQTFRKQGKRV